MSENWAGYVAGGDASNESAEPAFSRVSASWVQPTANCSNGQGSSAFWVGLGGEDGQSQSLEQAGTEADCSSDASPSYFAWYELLPAAPVRLGVSVKPGDHISTAVSVNGTAVTIVLSDDTTGSSTTKNLQMDDPDVSSAEWIAEAPSLCDGSGACQPVSLTDFGSVTFTDASATAGGHSGPISDSQWSAQPVELGGASPEASFGAFGADESTAGATPSSLSGSGSSFSVAWQSADSQSATQGSTGTATEGGAGAGSGGYGLGGGAASSGYPGYGVDPGAGGSGYGGSGYGDGGSGYGGGGYGGAGYGDGGGGYGGYGYGGGGYGAYGYGGGGYGGYAGAGFGGYGD